MRDIADVGVLASERDMAVVPIMVLCFDSCRAGVDGESS